MELYYKLAVRAIQAIHLVLYILCIVSIVQLIRYTPYYVYIPIIIILCGDENFSACIFNKLENHFRKKAKMSQIKDSFANMILNMFNLKEK